MALIFIRVDLLFPSSTRRAHAHPCQVLTSSSTNAVDLHLLGTPACSPPPTLVVRGLAPAWPWFGATVLAYATVPPWTSLGNSASFFYPSLYSISSICSSSAY